MPSLNKTTYCPECQGKITLKKAPRLGQTIVCKSCQTRLEVIETEPLELDWSFDDDDDGDDYSDYETDYDTYDEDLDSRIYSNY